MGVHERVDEVRPRVLDAVRAVLKDSRSEHHVAGIGVMYDELSRLPQREGQVMMGLTFLLILRLLRSLLGSGAAAAVSIGGAGWAGRPGPQHGPVTLPVLVRVLGVADCIHIFQHAASHPGADPAGQLGDSLQPCLFTSLSTMAGIASLATSRMAVVRDLGLCAAAGIRFTFLYSAGLPGSSAGPASGTATCRATGGRASCGAA